MTLQIYKPTHPVLKELVECFYILEQSIEEIPITYFTFPSIYTIVTISEKTKTIVNGNKIIIQSCPNAIIETNLVSNFNEPVLVNYEGKINEITTYFKPLGINAFINHDLQYYSKGTFPDFVPFDDYKDKMTSILSINNNNEKIEKLELYWISKLRTFENPLVKKVIIEMMDSNNLNQSMSEISLKTGCSRTTIKKHFDKHICKTPSQFKKIVRFRATIENQIRKENRTNVSYSMDYFDQSHMIKDFKKLTGFTPKAFFSKVSMGENSKIKWLFV